MRLAQKLSVSRQKRGMNSLVGTGPAVMKRLCLRSSCKIGGFGSIADLLKTPADPQISSELNPQLQQLSPANSRIPPPAPRMLPAQRLLIALTFVGLGAAELCLSNGIAESQRRKAEVAGTVGRGKCRSM